MNTRMFAKDDIVRVVKQPEARGSQVIPLIQGEVALVESVGHIGRDGKEYVQIILLRSDGSLGGGGAIPAECLAPEDSVSGKEAARRYRERMAAMEKVARKRGEEHRLQVLDLALKYNITPEAVLDIHKTLDELEDSWRG